MERLKRRDKKEGMPYNLYPRPKGEGKGKTRGTRRTREKKLIFPGFENVYSSVD
jgi:hypothetical protein